MFDTLPFSVDAPAGPSAEPAGPAGSARSRVSVEEARRYAAEWADCSGAVLAKLIAEAMVSLPQIPDSLAGDQQVFDLITANARLAGWAAANQARLTALVHGRALAEHQAFGLVQADGQGGGQGSAAGPSHGYDDHEYTSAEIAANLAMELGQSMPTAARDVRFALGLARDSAVLGALAAGRMDTSQARAIIEELDQVAQAAVREPVIRALVTDPATITTTTAADGGEGEEVVLVRELRGGRNRLWDLSPAQLRSIIRRQTQTLDPTLTRSRAQTARRDRHVRFHQRRDAMADLVLHGPAEALAATYQHLNFTAHAAQHQHHHHPQITDTTLGQLRHDIAVGWLTQGEHGLHITYRADPDDPINLALPTPTHDPVVLPRAHPRPKVAVNVTVAETTLLGLDQLPATLHTPTGPMPIPADLARTLAYQPDQATWRRILCDPKTGTATDTSPTYRPPPRIADHVKIRDGFTSRFPASTTTHLELDHILRYRFDQPHTGGPTTSANLGSQGLPEHHLKTDGALTITGNANGPLTYRGRSGHPHTTWPHQHRNPAPDQQPGREPDRPPSEQPRPDNGDPPF